METLREEAPSSYSMKIVGFSEMKLCHQPYESATFNASGYKWRLIFHPAGKLEEGGKDHVSIFARIENVAASEMLMHNWEVKAELKFFIYNHTIKKYSTFQDGTIKSYNKDKKEWGLAQMLPISKFSEPSNGYIDEDTCIVGVEIFVIKPMEKVEKVVYVYNPPNNKFTWKITHFSKLVSGKYHYSDEFVVGDRNWRMKIMKGEKEKRALSIYLQAMAYLPNAVLSSTYAKMKLRILNQKTSDHFERDAWHFYKTENETGTGRTNVISMNDLTDESKGYIVENTIVLEIILTCITDTKLVDSI